MGSMVDFPRFEAHPVDLQDAAEMPPHADAGERLRGAEIRFRGKARRRSSSVIYNELESTSAFRTPANGTGGVLKALQERYSSSYVSSFASRLRDFDTPSDASLLKEIYRSNPERVVQIIESQPSLHNNSSALSQYVKALVALDRLDESPLLKTLQRGSGLYCLASIGRFV
ncbi:hypothetical protein ZWY2020_004009 [Hordeum vulgare]|nr:hypothetical protein ZWY2020_004009 [Hordeum vulgare]